MAVVTDDYGNPLSINQTPIGDQPGDYPMPTTAQTPGFATTWTGGLSGTSGDQEGDYPMPTTGQTPGWTSGFSLDKLLSSIFGTGGISSQIGSALSTPSGALTGLLGLYALSQMNKTSPSQYAGYAGSIPKLTATRQPVQQPEYKPYSGQATMGRQFFTPVTYAASGGIMEAAQGRYLKGSTDGMADEIPSSIDGQQPAKLSHGEFVVPADVVSHLGNGNSDAGADVLYKMMDRVRKARTGNPKQGKRINPDKFTPGGIAGYADGGAVAFAGDDPAGSLVKAAASSPVPISQSSTLSPWVGDYVTQMLGQGQALAQMPYQAYQGPLTAGTSPLQQQAFSGLSSLGGQSPWQYGLASNLAAQTGTSSFAQPGIAQSYMSPYMQNVVDVQQQQAQRQADIAAQADKARFAQAGAFGGGRFGIQQQQAAADLARQKQAIQAQGLQSAFQQGQQQFNAEQQARLAAAQGLGTLGAGQFGTQLQGLQALLGAGATQYGQEQAGITALQNEYNKQMMWPYQQLQFQQSLLGGLPIGTTTAAAQTGAIGNLANILGGLQGVYGTLKGIPGFGG